MKFIEYTNLEDLFRSGRFKRTPTVIFSEISAGLGLPPEAIITDREGQELGACWTRDIERILSLAALENDTDKSNPNLMAFRFALNEMNETRRDVVVLAEKIRQAHETTVVHFPQP